MVNSTKNKSRTTKSKTAKKKTTAKKAKTHRNTKRKQNSTLKKTILLGLGSVLLLGAAYIGYCWATLPDLNEAIEKTRQPAVTITAENGNEIHTFGNVYSEVVKIKDLPQYVPDAILSIEDRRFYHHFGFDPIAFSRAVAYNLLQKKYAQGASTITQQVAKNLFLTPQKNIKRKVQELLLAFWLEKNFSKDQILALYINRVYFGGGVYGIEAASNKYFQKTSADLNLREAAMLAGMLKAPSRYSPENHRQRAIERSKIVLNAMINNGKITREQMYAALNMPIGDEEYEKVKGGRYFADFVLESVKNYIPNAGNDMYVYTTLDQQIQETAERVLKNEINSHKTDNVSQGAVVVLDYNGAILAMVGGIDYNASQFNRAVQALRQSGSAFKPFVYLTALQNGYTPESKILDLPMDINGWKPQNYDKKYYGSVSLKQALANSLNLAAVSLSQNLPHDEIIRNAKRMGISSKIEDTPSIALGTSLVKVLDMATAYASFANGGYAVWPYAIKEIYTRDGYQLYMRISDEPNRIFSEQNAKDMQNMLEAVITSGTGKKAKLPIFAAGKTGTTQDYKDAWFVGFTDKYVIAVWVGNDDASPMKKITGGGLPAEIWRKIASQI